jgi:hypothetical protein
MSALALQEVTRNSFCRHLSLKSVLRFHFLLSSSTTCVVNSLVWRWIKKVPNLNFGWYEPKRTKKEEGSYLKIKRKSVWHEHIMVKSSMCLTKHHAMKMYWGSGV